MNRETNCFFCERLLSNKSYKLTLLDHQICGFCETVLIKASVLDPCYDIYKQKIKKLWFA